MLRRLFKSVVKSSDSSPPNRLAVTQAPVAAANPSRFTYSSDGLSTTHDATFLRDARFQRAYALGAASGHRICEPEDLHIEWRVYICCWAAEHARRLGGDFVECGVSTGIVSRAVADYVDFGNHSGKFWLVDTFEGIPIQQALPEERGLAASKNSRHYYDCFEEVQQYFSRYGNVNVVKGQVPDALAVVVTDRVAYLHIDMNIAEPEVAAMEYFWDKLAVGAIVVLDDYGSLAHAPQKRAMDQFAATRGTTVLTLPTGQGLLLRS